MARIRILDPTAEPPATDPDPGPDAGTLSGRTVGIRHDSAWRSWEWVLDEWSELLLGTGAEVVTWRAGNRIGDEGTQTFAELDAFAGDVDVALVGLGN
jgi:hypothetical protein